MSRFCAYFGDFLSHLEEFWGQVGDFRKILEELGETWRGLEGLGGAWRFFGKFFWLNVYISVVFKGL